MNISEIIIKYLLGTATEEEQEQLTSWRNESKENEEMFARLTDPQYLQSEYRKRTAVNHARAAEQMKQRIGKERPLWLRPAFYRTAAAVALIAVCSGIVGYLYNNVEPQQEQIAQTVEELKAGRSIAVLTLANGKDVELDESTDLQTIKSIAKAEVDGDATKKGNGQKSSKLTLSVPRGGEFKIELEDGTEVWLNAQSRLIYPETFSETERRVEVEGEAYFKVAKNEAKPFFVEADNQVVRVVGTEFNIHSYKENKTVQTTLVTGKIAMQQKNGGDREMILTPGHQAVFDKSARSIKVKSVDTDVVTSWKDGMFVFEDQNLAEIMSTLSRWYDFDYTFTDEKAASTVFMGRIPRYSDFSDVMQIIEMSGGLKLTLNKRKLTISSTK